mmetsp:Transcript_13736/g.34524  ORF Transcript_13736/g.34524 Transcript_13736/m.34524 type:complete len:184 (+) Transcript_13736:143-694(+)
MRNSSSTIARSSASVTHPQLLAHSTIADGYDFNRARSSESTENALTAKAPSASASSEFSAIDSSFASSATAEDRGVPVSPKKLPPTPPRDRGSPYRPHEPERQDRLLQPRSNIGQSFLSPRSPSSGPLSQPFLRPSSWRHKEEDHGSIFRSPAPVATSGEDEGYFTIQRSYAFDEDDASDSEL